MGAYMLWADDKIWDIVNALTEEEFSRTIEVNSGSIRDRYLHMAQGHSQWYCRWMNEEQKSENLDNLSREELFSYLSSINSKLIALVQKNTTEEVQISGQSRDILFRLDEMVFNIINHASYHRGQIVTLLRMLGKEVVVTDYVPYLFSTSRI